MAALTLRATSTSTASGSTLSLTKPTGTSSGDLLVAVIAPFASAVTAPSGWTLYVQENSQLFVFYKLAGASEPSTYKFVTTYATTAAAVMLDYYGATTLSANNLEQSYKNLGNSTSPSVATVKNTDKTDLVVWCLGAATHVATGPSGFAREATSTHTRRCEVWQKAPGSATTATYTGSLTNGGNWQAIAVVLTPSSAPALCSLLTPTTGSYQDAATGQKFTAKYNSTDGANANKYALRIAYTTGTHYYTATTGKLVATIKWNTCAVAPGTNITVTVPATVLSSGTHYGWSIAAQEATSNLKGTFAPNHLFTAASGPGLSVQGPAGTETSAKPTVKWTASPSTTLTITYYRVVVFTTAQHAVATFTPATSTSTYDSGTLAGNVASLKVGTALSNGTKYYAYVQVKETGTVASSWASITFTVSFDEPAKPTVTASNYTTPTTTYPLIKLTVQCHDNLLTANQASFESGTTGWTAGRYTTISQASGTTPPPLDGSYVLEMTPGTITMTAQTTTGKTGFAVAPSTKYTVMASFLAKATARICILKFTAYNATGTDLGVSTVASGSDYVTQWVGIHGTITTTANAAFGALTLEVATTATALDIHYVDEVGIFPGTVTTWTAGGFVGTTTLEVIRSTVTATATPDTPTPRYIRFASQANPTKVPTPSQKVTLYTAEPFPTTTYQYLGIVVSGTQTSGTGTKSTAVKTTPDEWWEVDPTTRLTATHANPVQWSAVSIDTASAHQVTGQTHMTVISDVMLRQAFRGTFKILTASIYDAFEKLLENQKTIFIASSFRAKTGGYYRVGPEPSGLSAGMGTHAKQAQLNPSSKTGPDRTVQVLAVAQRQPPV